MTMDNEAYELDGFDGKWHAVTSRPVSYDAMRIKLGNANTGVMSMERARDMLNAGDAEFSAVNPRTMATEVYAVVTEDDGQTFQLFRQM